MGRKGEEISNDIRHLIIKMHLEGKSLRVIGSTVGRSLSTIQYIVKVFKTQGVVDKKQRNSNRKKLTRRHQSFLIREVRKDPTVSAPNLAKMLHLYYNITVTSQTVRNYLRKLMFRSRIAARKPFINRINRMKRVNFAKKYLKMGFRFWKRVIFSDECKFNIKLSDGITKIWREKNKRLLPKNLLPTFKHCAGSVMMWGCFAAGGVGKLAHIDGIMNAKAYINILRVNLGPSAEKLGLTDRYFFQQDNDPKHTAQDTRLWILYNCPFYLKTPPQSPDLNPIENLWHI